MHLTDIELLSKQGQYANATAAVVELERCLNVAVSPAHALHDELFKDLDEQRFGIGWWHPHPDDKRRILISDHLIQAISSMMVNLTEAGLHLLEFHDCAERWTKRYERVLTPGGHLQMPPITSPMDLVPERLATMHVAGFLRAVGSTLDTLAASIIGVIAVPMNILTGDLDKTRAWLRQERQTTAQRHPIQKDFAVEFEGLIRSAGPPGWIEWAMDYRNMLVHRGRRVEIKKFEIEPYILDANGRQIPRSKGLLLLARDPHLSNVQAQIVSATHVIPEDARQTLPALLESTRFLVNETCERLSERWKERRGNPLLLVQPAQQWPDVKGSSKPFGGYEAKNVDLSADTMRASPVNLRRMLAACLDSRNRHRWDAGLTGS